LTDYNTYSDDQLIALLKASDEKGFDVLYDRYADKMFLAAYNKLKDNQQSQEVVHDVFLNIWKNRTDCQITNVAAYLKQAVRLRVINVILRKKSHPFFDLFDSIIQSPFEADHPILKKDLIYLIESWIKTFPENRRKIFVKHYFEGLSHLEIAKEMELSPKTIQNQLSISIQHLKSNFAHLMSVIAVLSFFK
jgi:RNA polymerase sigma factor (sigma-70 family)